MAGHAVAITHSNALLLWVIGDTKSTLACLDGEPAHVSDRLGDVLGVGDDREAREDGRLGAHLAEDVGAGELGDVIRDLRRQTGNVYRARAGPTQTFGCVTLAYVPASYLEVTLRGHPARVDDALGNLLARELAQLLDEVRVLDDDGPGPADGPTVDVVEHRGALVGRERGRAVPRVGELLSRHGWTCEDYPARQQRHRTLVA